MLNICVIHVASVVVGTRAEGRGGRVVSKRGSRKAWDGMHPLTKSKGFKVHNRYTTEQ